LVSAQWLSNSSAVSERVSAALAGALNTVSRPHHMRRIRLALICLLACWAAVVSARLIWALVPSKQPAAATVPAVINPVAGGASVRDAVSVDIDGMVAWHLFGEPNAAAVAIPTPVETEQANSRVGIEDGAEETRLQLMLRGVVSSTEDGLGFAIIENSSLQDVYAVGDKLPVQGEVVLAKVMPRQVVLDNGGTYELLLLYEESSMGASGAGMPVSANPGAATEQVDRRADAETTNLALSYRERLYQNPQSLVDVVSISAVREGATMVGYRVSPGKDAEQFAQLGFQSGDVVTAINGVSLDNPTNTMVLYNSLRTAADVVFELQREGQQLTLSVNLDGGASQ
jgi:general secretion pathway protein C